MAIVVLLLVILALIVIGSWALGLVFSLLWWVLVGALIGVLGRMLIPDDRRPGVTATVLSGIVGSLLGGVIANALDVGRILEFGIAVLVAAGLILAFSTGRRGATA
jgi:uncharacterized membrane protein YeaQ/YmgE (transglycosylase-associated protein family)